MYVRKVQTEEKEEEACPFLGSGNCGRKEGGEEGAPSHVWDS